MLAGGRAVLEARVGRKHFLENMHYDVVRIYEAFELCDIAGSGAIDVDELRTGMRVLGLELSQVVLDEMLAVLDADGSGAICVREVLAVEEDVQELEAGGDELLVLEAVYEKLLAIKKS